MTNERDPVTIEPATGDETTEAAGDKPEDSADPTADPTATDGAERKPDDKPSGRAEDTPSGAWNAFAPSPAVPPGRFQRWTGELGRVLGHEWTVVSILSVLLS